MFGEDTLGIQPSQEKIDVLLIISGIRSVFRKFCQFYAHTRQERVSTFLWAQLAWYTTVNWNSSSCCIHITICPTTFWIEVYMEGKHGLSIIQIVFYEAIDENENGKFYNIWKFLSDNNNFFQLWIMFCCNMPKFCLGHLCIVIDIYHSTIGEFIMNSVHYILKQEWNTKHPSEFRKQLDIQNTMKMTGIFPLTDADTNHSVIDT